ncbi:MAG: hypothetical protein WA941_14230 [Nitrososphaeraceae archaeon]
MKDSGTSVIANPLQLSSPWILIGDPRKCHCEKPDPELDSGSGTKQSPPSTNYAPAKQSPRGIICFSPLVKGRQTD